MREYEAAICAHMNADHADSTQHYAETLLDRTLRASAEKTPQWLMTGVDVEGCDLRRGGETPRHYFVHTVATVEETRAELARLAGKMR